MEEPLIEIPRPPRQTPLNVISILKHNFRGDSIYIVLGGICVSVVMFLALMDMMIVAVLFSWIPVALSILFVAKFVEGKSAKYFSYWIEEKLEGAVLRQNPKRRRR